jgi:hypothetical protein
MNNAADLEDIKLLPITVKMTKEIHFLIKTARTSLRPTLLKGPKTCNT